ncbi:MAG: gliding motility-associated ABC transporter ATP-binding subunit GldA [Saprospiraceae bacterium]
MSVLVNNLTKIYGEQRAVNNISFEAKKGEVLGFLGPNGAGKTTTMKIITCFIPQSEGQVTVCGHDVAADPIEVRRHIGYLPEHNPLYKEMYVKEYLTFIAGMHKLKNKRNRVDEMVEMTGLTREQNKPISALSKGYRQRVGLAQAMLHDPEVLILDEPTSGLDPNQLVEIRSLIKRIGEEKTVIFSTHIMQEVQALCDRVVIINKGNLVADDTIDELKNRVAGEAVITVEFLEKTNKSQLSRIKGITKIVRESDFRWKLSANITKDIRPEVFTFAVQNQLTMVEMSKEVFSIENAFQQLTK